MSAPRAVVTGLGVVAPNGMRTEEYWASVLDGKSGIGRISRFDPHGYPVTLAGELTAFEPAAHVPNRLIHETSTMSHLALSAARQALDDAAFDPTAHPEYELGVITANATGGVEFGQRELQNLWSKGPSHVSAYMSIAWFFAATTGQLSIRHQLRGHCGVIVAEQAGGLDAVGHGRRALREQQRMVLVGGTESALSPAGVVAQVPTGRLSRDDDPTTAYRPFAPDACGYVPGEGGALLVVEDAASAAERGAPQVYGEIAGHASTFDPPPGSDRRPTLRLAAELAMADAGVVPAEVDVVFADAAGTVDLDAIEATAIRELFGPDGVAVTAPKTMTGRLGAGSGPLDVATALLSIRDGIIPPTVATATTAAPHRIDLVCGAARTAPVRTALVLARGYGGFNSAVVVRALP